MGVTLPMVGGSSWACLFMPVFLSGFFHLLLTLHTEKDVSDLPMASGCTSIY